MIRERLGACDLISWCPLAVKHWSRSGEIKCSSVIQIKFYLPPTKNFVWCKKKKTWRLGPGENSSFIFRKRNGAIRKRSRESCRVCVLLRVSFSLFFSIRMIYFRILLLSFPKGSLFRLAKCLFPSERAKSKQNDFSSFSKWKKELIFGYSLKMMWQKQIEIRALWIKQIYMTRKCCSSRHFLFWFRRKRRSERKKIHCLGFCCEINMCAFFILIRKSVSKKSKKKIKIKRNLLPKIFDLFGNVSKTFLVLSHMLLSRKKIKIC